jgi:hypothetical protein
MVASMLFVIPSAELACYVYSVYLQSLVHFAAQCIISGAKTSIMGWISYMCKHKMLLYINIMKHN